MNERLHMYISGRVQGVGFRYFVMRQAKELGLTGWTRNLADGCAGYASAGESTRLRRVTILQDEHLT